jgi:hypothetical protein
MILLPHSENPGNTQKQAAVCRPIQITPMQFCVGVFAYQKAGGHEKAAR